MTDPGPQAPDSGADRRSDLTQDRGGPGRWTIWACPECGEQSVDNVDESRAPVVHYCDGPCRVPSPRAIEVEVVEAASREEWTCPHGTTYTGLADFVSGARNAHDEIANRDG